MADKLEILQKWANASRDKTGFKDSLRSLLHYACAEIIRKNAPEMAQNSPEKAFFALLPYISEPIAGWNMDPLQNEGEILKFASEEHSVTIPQNGSSTFDLRGVHCPECSMRARLLIKSLKENSTAVVLLDNGSPAENVPASLIADGNSITKREKKDNFWLYEVQKH